MKKTISTRFSDFKQLITSNSLYVDKTEYVYRMVKTYGQDYFFISRPRRFGKSLMCSTLEYLFKGEKDLFKGLYIAEKTDYAFPEFPVLHINFAEIVSTSYEEFLLGFQKKIFSEAKKYGISLDLYTPAYMLSDFLDCIENQAVIIIDEFDSPVISTLTDASANEKIRLALSSFYSIIKNKGDKIRFFFITGVTKLSNMSIFSELNNLKDITMFAEYASAFGYTEQELEYYFDKYISDYLSKENCPYKSKEEFLVSLKDFYDGYKFSYLSSESVYNPVSVNSFFESGCIFRGYWERTGVSKLAIDLAKNFDLLTLVDEDPLVGMNAFTSFDISSIINHTLQQKYVYALLFYTGYLTVKGGDEDALFLTFPNKEVSSSFVSNLTSRYMFSNTDVNSIVKEGKIAAEKGDTKGILKSVQNYFEKFPYDLLSSNKEVVYQALFHAFFVAADSEALAEGHTLRGRFDNALFTRSDIYIFELKINKSSADAINQIKQRKYYRSYLPYAKKIGAKLHIVGINIFSRKREITDFKEEIITEDSF